MTIRISGFSSGLDIDKLVSTLMDAERLPVNKKTQRQTLIQYKMDQYREVNAKLISLKENINKMRFGTDFKAVTASSSNETAVKVSGSNSADVSTTINVVKLATQATKSSGANVTKGAGLDLTKSLSDNAANFSTSLDLSPSSLSISINGTEISYASTDTIQQIMSKVNQSNAGVAMSYDAAADKFVFISKQTGSDAQIKVEDVQGKGNLLKAIRMSSTKATGKDAVVKINGVESKRSSNTFTQDGVTYTLLQPTSTAVTVSNSSNATAIIDKIKEFVNLYNDVMIQVNQLTKQSKVSGYDPLTEDEKSAMSETDIANWEVMVKKGQLKNDSILTPFARTMRSFLSSTVTVEGTAYSAFNIGLGTAAFDGSSSTLSTNAGKIELDEDRLKEALESNPAAVQAVFTSVTTGEEGLFQKMFKTLNTTISEVQKKSGSVGRSYSDASTELGKQYAKIEQEISLMEDMLSSKEGRYYAQFTAMEKAIANSNSQLSAISSLLSS